MWDNVADHINCFEQDDFVKVRGLLNKFNGRFQLTVHKVRSMQESEVDFDDYLPAPPKTLARCGRLWANLWTASRTCTCRRWFGRSWLIPQIERAYKNAPAAKTLHHAFIGGLLDHVVSLFQLCDLACRNYPETINRDLLLTGAFLHDIGKVHELTFARSFTYTTRGQLLGHMIIELEMLQEKIAQLPGFPGEYKTLIEHLIISHHGKYEFGSPKLPMFPEALMLHYLDDLDSKMESMRAQFKREPQADWTTYNASLDRPLLNSKTFLEKINSKNGNAPAVQPDAVPPETAEPEDSSAVAAEEK